MEETDVPPTPVVLEETDVTPATEVVEEETNVEPSIEEETPVEPSAEVEQETYVAPVAESSPVEEAEVPVLTSTPAAEEPSTLMVTVVETRKTEAELEKFELVYGESKTNLSLRETVKLQDAGVEDVSLIAGGGSAVATLADSKVTPNVEVCQWYPLSSGGEVRLALAWNTPGFVVRRASMTPSFNKEQAEQLVKAAAEIAPPAFAPYLEKAAPVIVGAGAAMEAAYPYLMIAYGYLLQAWAQAESYHLEALTPCLIGLGMCFFGGHFVTTIAMVEAFKMCGWPAVRSCVLDVWEDLEKVRAAMAKDDLVDADGDGVADVKQIDGKKLLHRKMQLVLVNVNPDKVSNALAGIASGWIAVLATLRIRFAKAITLGAAIGDAVRKPAMRFLAPPLQQVVPPEYHQWIGPAINYACKSVAITVAWMVQRVISAFHSAVRGGQMFSEGLLEYLVKTGMIEPLNMEETYVDEILQWSVAVLGLLFQVSSGFSLAFPLNLLLLPLTIVEYIATWMVAE